MLILMILKWIILTNFFLQSWKSKNIFLKSNEVIVTFDKDVLTKILDYNFKKEMYRYSVGDLSKYLYLYSVTFKMLNAIACIA